MPNGVACRAFKTSSQRPVPHPASDESQRHAHGQGQPAQGGLQDLWAGQPEGVVRHHEDVARGEPPGEGHVAVQDHEEHGARDHPEEDLRPEHGDKDRRELHLTEPQPVGVEAEDLARCAQEGDGGDDEDQRQTTTETHGRLSFPRFIDALWEEAVRQRVLLALRQTGVYSNFHLIARSFYSSLHTASLKSKTGIIAPRQSGEPCTRPASPTARVTPPCCARCAAAADEPHGDGSAGVGGGLLRRLRRCLR